MSLEGEYMFNFNKYIEEKNFLWGGATAAYQCEGGFIADDKLVGEWDYFNHNSPLNINNEDGDVASDFFHKYKEDIDLMAASNQNTFRFSLSWSRIMLDVEGVVNHKGIDFYNNIINYCIEKNIEPNVTLYHYDFPLVLAQKGGWLNSDIAKYFNIYARICFKHFGDRVKLWSTINEPRYYSYCSNIVGIYPPNRKFDFQSYFQTIYNMMIASSLAVKSFRDMKIDGIIGIVHDSGGIEVDPDTVDKDFIAYAGKMFFHDIVLDPTLNGVVPSTLPDIIKHFNITLYRNNNDEAIFKEGQVDYIGMNLYARRYLTDYKGGETTVFHNNTGSGEKPREGLRIKNLFETSFDDSAPRNKWGRETTAKSMYNGIMYIKDNYNDPLILVTENGHGAIEEPDADGFVLDDERIMIVEGFINEMLRAKADGARVYGYYHWSSMDLYSWINGYNKRYGFIRIDFDDNTKRIPKKSYYWYKDFIDNYNKKS